MNMLPLHTQSFEDLVTLIFFQGHSSSQQVLNCLRKYDDLPECVDVLCYDYQKSRLENVQINHKADTTFTSFQGH